MTRSADKLRGVHDTEPAEEVKSVFIVHEHWGYDGTDMTGLFDTLDEAVEFVESCVAFPSPCNAEAIDITELPIGWNDRDENYDGKSGQVGYWVNTNSFGPPKWERKK